MLKLHGAGPVDLIMLGDGDPVIPLPVRGGAGGVIIAVCLCLSVKKPEGDIDPFQLLQMVGGGKGPGQKDFFPVVVFQGLLCRFLIQTEGDDIVRPQRPVKLPGDNGVVAAVGAGGGGGGLVGDQLRAAGGAVVGPHALGVLAPVAGEGGQVPISALVLVFAYGRFFPGFFLFPGKGRFGRLFLFGVESFYSGCTVTLAAVIALEHFGIAVEAKRSSAGGAFIIGYLCWHKHPPKE